MAKSPNPTRDRVDLLNEIADAEEEAVRSISSASFETKLAQAFNEAYELLRRKHADYGPKNISASPGGPLNGLRVRMHDKLARINYLIDTGVEPSNESLRDSFVDLANYGIIGALVIDGSWPQ